jgi:alpha-L-rhamnosidase
MSMIFCSGRAVPGQASLVARLSMPRSIFRSVVLVTLVVAAGFAACRSALGADPAAPAIERVTTNGRVNPLGIPAGDISFGWSATSAMRGTKQNAYQIQVGTSAGLHDVWDSGQVASDSQVDVRLPSSVTLQAATRYYWAVKIWDQEGRSSEWSQGAWFETGLLTEADWAGAAWLTRPVVSPNPNDWTNYTVTVEFTLQNQAFGVFLRSSADGQNAYMMQVNVTGSTPVFKPHRRTNGSYAVLATVDLSGFGFTNAGLTGTKNTLRFDVSGTTITTSLNGVTIDTRTGVTLPSGVVGFRTYGTESGVVHRVTVVDNATNATIIDPAFAQGANGFSGGVIANGALSLAGTIDAIYGNLPPSLPLFRGAFVAREDIVSARLYASAQGLYEVSVNGQKAGDQFLAPGWTDYNKRIQAQTYDITNLVQPGANAVGAALADGWFRGSVGINWTFVYGSQLAFVAKIKVDYADGSTEWFSTDAGWKASDGPYVRGDLQDGEGYDANLEQAGWDTAAFDDSGWDAVATIPGASSRLVPQPDAPVRVVTVLTAKSRAEILPQTWVYDLGQNMVGVPRVVLSGVKGQTITLKHAEEVYRTGAQTGQIYTANLRTAAATDTYTFAATGTVTYQPKFTQHGFRYIQITGTTTPPDAADVKGVVLSSDLAEIGDLQTSNSLVNQLVSNIRWGQRGNFLSIPTDTPARDERLGWTGDINVFSPAAARYKDTRAFLSKWMDDVRDAQKANGNIPAVVPQPGSEFDDTGVGWSDAFITIPYSVWKGFDDPRIIRQNWNAMKAFYQFVYDSATGDGDLLEQGRSSWFSGDWLTLENVARLEEHKVIATAYFAENTRMMSEMAAEMGETDKAAEWAALVPQIRQAFVAAYRSADGSIYTGTQTAYALALGMDMIADPAQRAQTADKFVQKLAADNYHLKTGFLGTPWLLPALSKIGREDLAMRLLLNEDYPSWGFPISMGATTMWERWNSIQPNGDFGPVDMNSFNHYAYGAVGDWMFGKIGGLQAEESGYKKSRIAPLIGYGGLTQAHCTQDTAFGRLDSEWSVSGGNAILQVQIPVNTTATVHVPASNAAAVMEGSLPAGTAPGVQFLRMENGDAVYEVGSGSYVFTSAPPLTAPTGLAVAASSMKAALTWDSVMFAAGYNIKRAVSPGGPYTTVASNVPTTSYTDTGLVNGAAYYYVVSSVNDGGESADSGEVSAAPRLITNAGFEAPATSTYVYNPGGGGWTFSAQSGSNGSGVTANGSLFSSGSANAPEGQQAAFLQGNGSITQVISGLTPGVTYNVLFSAGQRVAGASWNLTGETWNVTIDGAVIASYAPGQAATTYADYSATFTATAATHTLAFVGTKTTDNTIFLDNVRLVRSAAATGLANGGFEAPSVPTYQYNPGDAAWTFQAESGSNGSGIARNASLVTSNNPNAPEGAQVAFLQGNATITQTVGGLTPGMRYHLLFSSAQRATFVNGGQTWDVTLDGAPIASFKPGAGSTAYTGYAATFTATAATHTLAFVGTNTNTGDNTALIDDVRLSPGSPAAPAGLSAVAGNKQVQLGWSAVSGATGYEITRSTSGGADVVLSGNGTQTTFTDFGLTNGIAYSYRVSAADESGAGPPSDPATATPTSPPITEQEKSAPLIALSSDGSGNPQAVVSIPGSVPGHFYTLQSCTDLPAGDWQAVSGFDSQEGTGGALQFVVTLQPPARQRFFRMLIQE